MAADPALLQDGWTVGHRMEIGRRDTYEHIERIRSGKSICCYRNDPDTETGRCESKSDSGKRKDGKESIVKGKAFRKPGEAPEGTQCIDFPETLTTN